ncbi:supervillin-like [Sitophilus oryzae]|uniref:Supervillin-like n=1 Tax=Sitophilus oryzae TaxID=7048 RepID=A0A6J2YMZ4_SITOR|nr:supervillin-like [Sitophilus oryzae]
MSILNVQDLILSKYEEPRFYVNFNTVLRPTVAVRNEFEHKINKTNHVLCWRIQENTLEKIDKKNVGFLFDSEAYIVHWLFDLKIDQSITEEMLVYYWRGQHAVKGYSPLPSDIEEQYPVERLFQWSEPALFFHGFEKLIVFNGKETDFDLNIPHLFLLRGEVTKETHLFEVPCIKASLRSRGTFLLVIPQEKIFFYWHGAKTLNDYKTNIKIHKPHVHLQLWQPQWEFFSIHEIEENNEPDIFLETVKGNYQDFYHIKTNTDFSPKLFYLNTITGSFLATEVEYPLRKIGGLAPFPFLQNHLYSASEPALFLLDNNTEIWIWEGKTGSNSDNTFKDQLKLAKDLQLKYCEEKRKITNENIKIFYTKAGQETLEFRNIFPVWEK